MFTIFGAVAVVLASVGIYGVMSFSVNQRTQEFGVRMALGANDGTILGMVLRQGVVQIGIGLMLGLGLALAIATVAGSGIQSTLFGVGARDPLTYTSVALLVTDRVAGRDAGAGAAGDARRPDDRPASRIVAQDYHDREELAEYAESAERYLLCARSAVSAVRFSESCRD